MPATHDDLTIVELFARRVDTSGSQPALRFNRTGTFEAMTWDELAVQVERTMAGFEQLGVGPGDRVVQYAENSADWIVNDLAIQALQAIHVPIHAAHTADQMLEQVEHCDASCVILGAQTQADQLAAVDTTRLHQRTLLVSEPMTEPNRLGTLALDTVRQSTDASQATTRLNQARRELTPDAIATILYTSGTTGTPKGVVLTHRNLVTNTMATIAAFGIEESDLRLTFLPLSHIFARTCDLYTWMALGSELALATDRETIVQDCLRLGPTMLNGVPYFYQRLHRYLTEEQKADEPGSLRKLLGGKIRMCCSGGAALPDYVYDFFQQHEIPLLQGYGLTESSPVITLNAPSCERRGTVGRPIPGVEVRIADDGEVLARGPNIMRGYYLDQTATRETLRDGWLHTGDYGSLDDEGFLSITGRKNEMIVTAGGKNIAPCFLESLLAADPLIAQAVIFGDERNYLTALIVPDPKQIRRAIRQLRILPMSRRWVLSHPRLLQLYQRRIEKRLLHVSRHEQVRRFHLMDRGFTPESGEMTPKLSLKRSLIERNCVDVINAMYARSAADAPSTWQQRVVTFVRSIWA